MSTQKHKRQLLTPGDIVRNLHYGPFAVNWWFFTGIKTKTAKVKQIAIPIRVNMRIKFELNQTEVIIRVVDNNWKHGYVCELDMEAIIYSTPSAAINETYKKKINVKTRFSGPGVLGFDNDTIIGITNQCGWSRFSPTDITKLIEEPLHKPTPNVSTHTKPNSLWNFSLIRTEDKSNVAIFENTNHLERQNEKSPLESGWTLKSSHKYGQRGTGKRISMTVKAYLEGREFGNVEFDEMQLMVVYRSARNKVTHKRIWKPDGTRQAIKRHKALECADEISNENAYIHIRQRRILRSGIGKIINYLYNM
ncbi:hypothetical protein RhiirB3_430642 [Rhizophagus irregularis]|nr:hypothetical protein RhiirB3_430642 [Rhizophagus irregularis]